MTDIEIPSDEDLFRLVREVLPHHPQRERIVELLAAGAKPAWRTMDPDPDADPESPLLMEVYIEDGDETISVLRQPVVVLGQPPAQRS